MHKPFDGHFHLKVGYGGSTSLRRLNVGEIESFYEGVLNFANEALSHISSPSTREHYNTKNTLDRAIENMFHLIECRNIILWVVESVEAMEAASYCGTVISMLVMDKTSHNVARLLPI